MESFHAKIRFLVSLENFGRCNADHWMEMVRGTPFRQFLVLVPQFTAPPPQLPVPSTHPT